jgi:LysR family glycine cleavage system transcriptional activator
MAARLPALSALRTFEAAARHLSFTRAADELHVTQAAVSHQIKALEEDLGVRLFPRLNRRLLLTDEGQLLMPAVRRAFDELAAGVERVRERRCGGTLTISSTPSIAANWLASRLGRFQALRPEFEIRLMATPRLVDFAREGVDCGIRYGFGAWPGLLAERLFGATLTPVCSPRLLDGPAPLKEPADLARHSLLHALDDMDDWRLWLRAAGLTEIDPQRGPKFESMPLALQAAISGTGVAITRGPLADEALAGGLLVHPFALELPSECAYYFVVPELRASQPKIQAFRAWLLEEVAAAIAEPRGTRAGARLAAE